MGFEIFATTLEEETFDRAIVERYFKDFFDEADRLSDCWDIKLPNGGPCLGSAWDGKTIHRPSISRVNDMEYGRPNAGVDMNFNFPTLIAHATKTRRMLAGTIVGSGTVPDGAF